MSNSSLQNSANICEQLCYESYDSGNTFSPLSSYTLYQISNRSALSQNKTILPIIFYITKWVWSPEAWKPTFSYKGKHTNHITNFFGEKVPIRPGSPPPPAHQIIQIFWISELFEKCWPPYWRRKTPSEGQLKRVIWA